MTAKLSSLSILSVLFFFFLKRKHVAIYFPQTGSVDIDTVMIEAIHSPQGELSRVRKTRIERQLNIIVCKFENKSQTSSSHYVKMKWSPDCKFSLAIQEKRSPFRALVSLRREA